MKISRHVPGADVLNLFLGNPSHASHIESSFGPTWTHVEKIIQETQFTVIEDGRYVEQLFSRATGTHASGLVVDFIVLQDSVSCAITSKV